MCERLLSGLVVSNDTGSGALVYLLCGYCDPDSSQKAMNASGHVPYSLVG